jgi:glutamate-ammonia-ligase adenylyltransferase
MSFLSSISDCTQLPLPFDAHQAAIGFERWRERAAELDGEQAAAARALADDPTGGRLLGAIFGNSPFLTQCSLHDPACLLGIVRDGPDRILAELLDGLNGQLGGEESATSEDAATAALMRRLRFAKRRAALAVGIADIAGAWPLDRITGALSTFAEAAVGAAVRHLLAVGARAGQIQPMDEAAPEGSSGFFVLGMGKLGARELNYSSDIDLILLYDPEAIRFTGRGSVQQFFARLARDLVRMLEERTADGYVFRTDLRLRPDPASTPPALSVQAALTYYESTGQNWERAAMIKARPIAGDIPAGASFLRELRPFLWRKHLDFAAIQDIHSIKRQIAAHRGGNRIAVAGHNIKLGRGGIREIEFFVQTQQLIWGGRTPELRSPATCEMLRRLAEAGRITDEVADELIEAYGFLRRVEHRLQMIDDAQTHTIPADPAGLAHVATFLGYPSADAFSGALCDCLVTVERRYAELFEEAPSLSGQGNGGNLVFTGTEDDPATLETLSTFGFAEPAFVSATVRGWHHGRYRAMRSQRAREIMTELVPALLAALGRSGDPDGAFRRFDQFLGRLPAGVPILSLFQANPGLLAFVAEVMGGAPRLAQQLAERPILLDGVLTAGFFDPLPGPAELAADLENALAAARDFQDVLDIARRWCGDRKFQVGVQMMRGLLGGEAAGASFAAIADAVVCALVPRVTADMARVHGTVPGGGLCVVALGAWGGRAMTATSDLDMLFIYEAPPDCPGSDGERPLAVTTYYARLGQRIINALTAPTGEGRLYEVDMRLRPSGNAGPLASSLEAFERYQRESAWTWEHMALTRARVAAGPEMLRARIEAVEAATFGRPRDPARLLADIADMRRRIAAEHARPGFWDIKHRRGGLVDVEFIAQYLELREAPAHPAVVRANTIEALTALRDEGVLPPPVADDLIDALVLWRRVRGMLALLFDGPFDQDAATAPLKALLAQSAQCIDFASLKAKISATAERALAHFQALVERPAADLPSTGDGRQTPQQETGR